VLEARGVSLTYASAAGDVHALADVSLTVAPGEFLSILGPSGCGKSTLLSILGGLLRATSGDAVLDGRPLVVPTPRIGFVFQEPVLLPWRTVLENVLLPVQIQRLGGRHDARAHELLDLLGLHAFARHYPRELSGGMRQRVAIARALLLDPEVLLMDEPFGALDAINRERMNLELLRVWQGSRKTIVFVTHSIPEAVFLSDRVVAMTERPGRVKETWVVTLPRPRTLAMMEDATYLSVCRALRALMLPETTLPEAAVAHVPTTGPA
jgi:NitT/TauT family transport system ATP-binding protein